MAFLELLNRLSEVKRAAEASGAAAPGVSWSAILESFTPPVTIDSIRALAKGRLSESSDLTEAAKAEADRYDLPHSAYKQILTIAKSGQFGTDEIGRLVASYNRGVVTLERVA